MEIICPSCQQPNDTDAIHCSHCQSLIHSPDQAIAMLLKKQEQMELRHQSELATLKDQFKSLQKAIGDQPLANSGPVKLQPIKAPKFVDELEPTTVKHQFVQEEPNMPHNVQAQQVEPTPKKIVNREPSAIDLAFQSFFEPIFSGFDFVRELYLKYKAEGQLPIFFMTIGGAAALLFGFGYFLQYSLQYLGIYAAVAKIGLGFVTSGILAFFGFKLYRKSTDYHEYASALLSIGIVLNYLLIYFMSDLGDFPMLSSAVLGFGLIMANTVIAITIALKFKTKVISVLSLIGGSLAPFYLNATSDGTLYYMYLWILLIASAYLSKQIKWEIIKYLAFIVGLGLLQGGVFNYASETIVYNIYYHLYAYLFFYLVFFDRFELKQKLTKPDVIMLSGSLAFLLFNLYYTMTNNLLLLGIIYLVNSLVYAGITWKWWKGMDNKIKWSLFGVTGTFVAFAIPSIFDQSMVGLMWSIEALALIGLGFIHSLPIVRKEGYIILAIGVFKMITGAALIWMMWGETIWHSGLISLISLITICAALWALLTKYNTDLDQLEQKYLEVVKELTAPLILTALMAVMYHVIGMWSLNLTFITFFALLFWSDYFNTKFTNLVAFASLSLLVLSYAVSYSIVESYHLSHQLLYAKISIIELYATLWLAKEYYVSRNKLDHDFFDWSDQLRVLFFVLIPLISIYLINRHLHQFVIPGFWLATMINYLIHRKLKRPIYFYEFCAILFFGMTLTISEPSTINCMVGLFTLAALFILEKAFDARAIENSAHKIALMAIPYGLVVLMGLVAYDLTSEIGLSLAISSALILTMAYVKDRLHIMGLTIEAAIKVGNVMSIGAMAIYWFDPSVVGEAIVLISIVLHGQMLFGDKGWFKSAQVPRWNLAQSTFQLQILMFYTLVLKQIGYVPDGPLYSIILVLHGIIILFMFLKTAKKIFNQIALTIFAIALAKVVFNDIRDFDMMQKVLVLILIGVILLSASFVYIKLKKKYQPKNDTDE